MAFDVKSALLPKNGCTPKECEDAIAISPLRGRFAVADGATEAYDSGRWAKLLARTWAHVEMLSFDIPTLLSSLHILGDRLARRWITRELAWYEEEKAQSGAFAAFAALSVEDSAHEHGVYHWKAIALGDSCVFLEREKKLQAAIPIDSPSNFNYRPLLVPSSFREPMEPIVNKIMIRSDFSRAGDVFLLMTDAIACWYLSYVVHDERMHDEFHAAVSGKGPLGISDLIERERTAGNLRNDDVAILRVEIVNVTGSDPATYG